MMETPNEKKMAACTMVCVSLVSVDGRCSQLFMICSFDASS